MSDPRISAIIPNFNHAQYLPRSVGSYLNQPLLPYEIIVVDDASTDNSLEVLEAMARQHPIIRIIRNERNIGMNANMNLGLEAARGDYVLYTSADDEVRPGVFLHATRMLREHPQAGLCSGIAEWRCTATGHSWLVGGKMPAQPCYLSPAEMVALCKRGKLAINNQCTAYKKSVLLEAGGWKGELKWFSDWFAACTVGFRYGMCHVPEVLANFYLFPTSYYNSTARNYSERRAVMGKLIELLESDRYADVMPLIRQSGFMGSFGWSMLRVVLAQQSRRKYLTSGFLWQLGKRSAEVTGRRFFPDWLAKICLKTFYGRG
jgi:glycosyltransferase involved in cell wall biosynthesis